MHSIAHPMTELNPADRADQAQRDRLFNQPDLRALIRILNHADIYASAEARRDFYTRDFEDRLRIERIARAAINLLDPEIVDQAVEQIAEVLSADSSPDGVRPLHDQSPRLQGHFRALAQSCFNAALARLEERS